LTFFIFFAIIQIERRCTLKKFLILFLVVALLTVPSTFSNSSVRATSVVSSSFVEEEVHLVLGGDINTTRTVTYSGDEVEICYKNAKVVKLSREKNTSNFQLEIVEEVTVLWTGKIGFFHLKVLGKEHTYQEKGWFCLDRNSITITKDTPVPIYLTGCFPNFYTFCDRGGKWSHVWFWEVEE